MNLKSLSINYILLIATLLFFTTGIALGEYSETQKFYQQFLSYTCCWTNNCCFPVTPEDLTQMSNGKWMVNATGQIMPQAQTVSELGKTVFSPDGGYYRCACDLMEGQWVVHEKANTRCLAVPFQAY